MPYTMTEEFHGPFSSWSNVVDDYGAVGDGTTDDTTAIQNALNDLLDADPSCVLYFPAGTYKITSEVDITRTSSDNGIGLMIVGEDPATTIIRWEGAAAGNMMRCDWWYSKICRLQFDGTGTAGNEANNCLQIGTASGGDANFATYNEVSDCIFRDGERGILAGGGNAGAAECMVLRCSFYDISEFGLLTVGLNTLDWWVWYCLFQDCAIGINNNSGNFHAFQNNFTGITGSGAVESLNLANFCLYGNFVKDSRRFMDWSGGSSRGNQITIQKNRVVDSTGTFNFRAKGFSATFIADNEFKSATGDEADPIFYALDGDTLCIGNKFSIEPYFSSDDRKLGGMIHIDNEVVDPSEISTTAPTLPPVPSNPGRTVYEPNDLSVAEVQRVIYEAIAGGTSRPVVHLPQGVRTWGSPVFIPANSDVQIIGDGAQSNGTKITWGGPEGGAAFVCGGPCIATFRDIQIDANDGIGILIENADQEGGKILIDQGLVGDSSSVNNLGGVLVDGVTKTDVLMRALQGGAKATDWVKIVGTGEEQTGQFAILCGASNSARNFYGVHKNAKLIVKAIYHENSDGTDRALRYKALTSHGGHICVDSTRYSIEADKRKPTLEFDTFDGTACFTACDFKSLTTESLTRIICRGEGQRSKIFFLANEFWAGLVPYNSERILFDETSPSMLGGIQMCHINGDVSPVPDFDRLGDHVTNTSLSGKTCVEFNGVDNYISIPDHADFNFGSAMTVALWLKGDDEATANGQMLAAQLDVAGTDRAWWFNIGAGSPWIYTSISTNGTSTSRQEYAQTSNGVAYGRWTLAVMTYDGSDIKTYINGMELYTTVGVSGTGSMFDSSTNITIGARDQATATPFKGQMCAARFWNTVLTTDQINDVLEEGRHNTNTAVATANLVAEYSFNDETLGDDLEGKTFTDQSGNGHTATGHGPVGGGEIVANEPEIGFQDIRDALAPTRDFTMWSDYNTTVPDNTTAVLMRRVHVSCTGGGRGIVIRGTPKRPNTRRSRKNRPRFGLV